MHANILELVNKFIKVAGYMIKIQKSILFLFASSEESKNKIKKTISFTIT